MTKAKSKDKIDGRGAYAERDTEDLGHCYELVTLKDAMSERKSLSVKIPPYGPGPDLGRLPEAMKLTGHPKQPAGLLTRIKSDINERGLSRGKMAESVDEAICQSILRTVEVLEEELSAWPDEMIDDVNTNIVARAVRLGEMLGEMRMRDEHLERYSDRLYSHDRSQSANDHRRGEASSATKQARIMMAKLLGNGQAKNPNQAAQMTHDRGIGKSKGANLSAWNRLEPSKRRELIESSR